MLMFTAWMRNIQNKDDEILQMPVCALFFECTQVLFTELKRLFLTR